jgi:hypothetical protein
MIDSIENPPKYITKNYSGEGFVELTDFLINKK